MTLDEFDRRLLASLQENASLSVNELAEKVGLSPSPCWRRIQKLEAEGYIRVPGRIAGPEKDECRRHGLRRDPY
jgi:DNA-binding Lrp family transcriptional regulator